MEVCNLAHGRPCKVQRMCQGCLLEMGLLCPRFSQVIFPRSSLVLFVCHKTQSENHASIKVDRTNQSILVLANVEYIHIRFSTFQRVKQSGRISSCWLRSLTSGAARVYTLLVVIKNLGLFPRFDAKR
jgi:hypothetical protein